MSLMDNPERNTNTWEGSSRRLNNNLLLIYYALCFRYANSKEYNKETNGA